MSLRISNACVRVGLLTVKRLTNQPPADELLQLITAVYKLKDLQHHPVIH